MCSKVVKNLAFGFHKKLLARSLLLQSRMHSNWQDPKCSHNPLSTGQTFSFFHPVAVSPQECSGELESLSNDPSAILQIHDVVKVMDALPSWISSQHATPNNTTELAKHLLNCCIVKCAQQIPYLDLRAYKASQQLDRANQCLGSPIVSHPNMPLLQSYLLENFREYSLTNLTEIVSSLNMLLLNSDHYDFVLNFQTECYKRTNELNLYTSVLIASFPNVHRGHPVAKKIGCFLTDIIHSQPHLNSEEMLFYSLLIGKMKVGWTSGEHDKACIIQTFEDHLSNSDTHFSCLQLFFMVRILCHYFKVYASQDTWILNEIQRKLEDLLEQFLPHDINSIGIMNHQGGLSPNFFSSKYHDRIDSLAKETLPIRDIAYLFTGLDTRCPSQLVQKISDLLRNAIVEQGIDHFFLNKILTADHGKRLFNHIFLECDSKLTSGVIFVKYINRFFTRTLSSIPPSANRAAVTDSLVQKLEDYGCAMKRTNFVAVALLCLVAYEQSLPPQVFNKLLQAIQSSREFHPGWIKSLVRKRTRNSIREKQFDQVAVSLSGYLHRSLESCDLTWWIVRHMLACLRGTLFEKESSLTDKICSVFAQRFEPYNPLAWTDLARLFNYLIKTSHYSPEIVTFTGKLLASSSSFPSFIGKRFLLYLALVGQAPVFSDNMIQKWLSFFKKLSAQDTVDNLKLLANLRIFPDDLIAKCFSIKFLASLQEELNGNFSEERTTKSNLANINRTVLLHCPHLNVPWFLSKEATKYRGAGLKFCNDVSSVLYEIVDPKYVRQDTCSPYGHHIEFQIVLDEAGQPVENFQLPLPQDYQNLAVVLWDQSCYMQNMNRLCGWWANLIEDLLILGYKVVEIPHYEWYSMALCDHESRQTYLSKVIFGKSVCRGTSTS